MAQVYHYDLSPDEFQRQANHIMELLENQAFKDGFVTDTNVFSRNYSIVLVRQGMFSAWFERYFLGGLGKKQARFQILRNPDVNPPEPTDNSNVQEPDEIEEPK